MTPKMTNDSYLLLEKSGKLWSSQSFCHVVKCKLKVLLTFDEEQNADKKTKTAVCLCSTINHFRDIKIQLGSEAQRTQRKLNDHVYSFLLFASSRAEFQHIVSDLLN